MNKGFLGGWKVLGKEALGKETRGVDLHLSKRSLGRVVTLYEVFFTSNHWNSLKQVGEASCMSLLCPR